MISRNHDIIVVIVVYLPTRRAIINITTHFHTSISHRMTPREFVALYIMYEHNIMHLDCSHPHLNWIINHFQMNCQALESMDVDCTEVHNAIKDVQDAADRLHRVALEKQLAFFTTQEEPEEEVGGASLFRDNLFNATSIASASFSTSRQMSPWTNSMSASGRPSVMLALNSFPNKRNKKSRPTPQLLIPHHHHYSVVVVLNERSNLK